MGLYDDILVEEMPKQATEPVKTQVKQSSGLYDDLLIEEQPQTQKSFRETHPFVSSIPEAGKQFATRAVKSFPEFAKGANDLAALVGDKTGLRGVSNFGRSGADFWQRQSDKIQIDPKYQGVKGLTDKSTVIPTITGSVGDQFTNLLTAMGGGAGGAKLAGQVGLKGLAKAGLIGAGTSVPNLAQEGSYLDKIQAFQEVYGRIPTEEELRRIQNTALGEKSINTALETVADRLLFGKFFPDGTATKGLKNIAKNALQQAATEAGTEGMQEGVSIGAEKLLGINQGDNLARLADSMAIGGITGGVMGGAGTAVSQPYDNQFANNPNAVNPTEALKKVSAQIVNNGKVLYDSATDKLNTAANNIQNAANSINNMVNPPAAFDTLRQLRNAAPEEIAPNIAEKKAKKTRKTAAQETVMPNTETTPAQSEETQIADNQTSKRQAKKQETANKAAEKIRELAPNIAKKADLQNGKVSATEQTVNNVQTAQTEKQTSAKVMHNGKVLYDTVQQEKWLDKKNQGSIWHNSTWREIFEKCKTDPNTSSWWIEPIESSVGDSLLDDTKVVTGYQLVGEGKKGGDGRYKTKIPDVFNDYIRENIEQWNIVRQQAKEQWEIERQQVKNTEKLPANNIASNKSSTSNNIETIAKQYADMLGHSEVRKFHREFADALVNKKADRLKNLIAHGRGTNENSKKMFAKYTGIKLPSTIKGKIETIDKWANGEITGEKKTFDNNNKTIKIEEKDLKDKRGHIQHYVSDKYATFYDHSIALAKDYVNIENNESDFLNGDNIIGFNGHIDNYIKNAESSNSKLLENPRSTKYRGHSLIMFENGNKTVFLDKKKYAMVKDFDLLAAENSEEKPVAIKNKNGNAIGVIMPMHIPTGDLNTVKNISKPMKKVKKDDKIYSAGKKSDNNTSNIESETSNNIGEIENGERNIQRGSNERDKGISQNSDTGRTEQDRYEVLQRREDTGRNLSDNEKSRTARTASDLGADNKSLLDEHKEIIEKSYKNQHELNQAIENFINNKEYEKYDVLPEEVKDWLKKYAGAGGLEKQGAGGKGLLSEYYTPKNIVNKMWELTAQYVDTNGAKVLEPSAGIGRFLENAPKNTSFDVVEMNPVSAKITEILYPNTNVTVGEFQEKFINKTNNTPVKSVNPEYDIVIGNPPYGQYSGRYKGMGEGKKFSRIEAYFINRGLDTLKENGVMTFIVPSSFLDGAITTGKQEIGSKCELLDAYRLPENTFDTTSIGTDIIVLRKTKTKSPDKNLYFGKWFEEHPEKILGTVETRKNRFGRQENYVKGDKSAVENINIGEKNEKNIKQTVETKKPVKTTDKQTTVKKAEKPETVKQEPVQKVDYEVYKPVNEASEEEKQLYSDTRVDGTLPKEKYKPSEHVNLYKGELYNDFNYLQGNIYEKLDALALEENITEKQRELQEKKLRKVLPEPKTLDSITLNPLSDFVNDLNVTVENPNYRDGGYYYRTNKADRELNRYDEKEIPLLAGAIQYVSNSNNLTRSDFEGVLKTNVIKYLNGQRISIDYGSLPAEKDCNPQQKQQRNERRIQQTSDCKRVAEKLFNEYLQSALSDEVKAQVEDIYNREYNATYNPDYLKMPLVVQDVAATFKDGRKLELREAQIEGINFLNNQGVGLLGFDVGVGKTMTAIIATAQNMKLGRCKRPLVLCPKPTLDKNWYEEFKLLYPNMKINVLGNLGSDVKFDGNIEDNTITLCSYQALENIWYDEGTVNDLLNILYGAADKTTENRVNYSKKKTDTARESEKLKEDVEKMIGQAQKGNKAKFTFEQLGFDHITVDEAHNFKNLFSAAKAYNEKGTSYNVDGGNTSNRAVRLFLATQYVLTKNNNRNVYLLSATPFTNKPLEVFNMFSYIAKDMLDNLHCNNVHQFIETFAEMRAVDIVNDQNEIVTKDVCIGFKNKDVLYHLRDKFMLMRKGKESELKRPNKHTVRVVLPPTEAQADIINNAETLLSEVSDTDSKNKGAEVLQRINLVRNATLSPDIAMNNMDVAPDDLINNSPKLKYIAEAVKVQHDFDPMAHQIIYSPRGVKFFPKIKEYFVKNKIFKPEEVAIIDGSTNEDMIAEYIDQFNDEKGKLRLIIGSSTINEGINLNTYSTTIYLPFTDWNPTQHQQVVGRIWRSGNKYKDCRIVVPLLQNSSDPFMFQKLATKIERINDLYYDENGSFIDPAELDADEQRLALITNPVKKARAFVHFEEKKLRKEQDDLIARKDSVKNIVERKNNAESSVKYYEKGVAETEKAIEEMEAKFEKDEKGKTIIPENNWEYSYKTENLKKYKKYLTEKRLELKKVNAIIETREYDINGKDKPEIIDDRLEEIKAKIENLKEVEEKKREEYQKEYDKQQKEAKTIEGHIEDFKRQTKEMYGDISDEVPEEYSLGEFIENVKGTLDVAKSIKQGKKIGELVETEPIFQMFKEELAEFPDYTVAPMPKTQKAPNRLGRHSGKHKAIFLNMEAIGDDVVRFAEVLIHEAEHAKQRAIYQEAKNKKVKTVDDLLLIRDYEECQRVNKNKSLYYNEHKQLLDDINEYLKGLSRDERQEYISNLSPVAWHIYQTYQQLHNEYWNAANEVKARAAGTKAAERVKYGRTQNVARGNRQNDGIHRERNVRTRPQYSSQNYTTRGSTQEIGTYESSEFEAEEEFIDSLSEKSAPVKSQKQKISKSAVSKTKDKLYKWHGNIQKDRFDLNKNLQAFTNATRTRAGELSKQKGFKITDKQLREVMPFLRERTELPENLGREDLTKIWNSLTDKDKEHLTKMADTVSDKLETYYKNYNEAKGTMPESTIANHISHIWNLDKKAKGLMTNYFATNSRFAKQRTIDTLVKGINGIEINGEIVKFKPRTLDYAEILKISNDNLIKATHDYNLANEVKTLKDGKQQLVMASNKAPSDWVEISHPALNKAVYAGSLDNNGGVILRKGTVKVHPDIADSLKAVFEVQKPDSKGWVIYDTLNAGVKQAQLGFSGFHGWALTESAISNMGLKETLKVLNPKKIWNSVVKGDYDIYKQDDIAKDAMEHGLQLGTPTDLDRGKVEELLKKIPFINKTLGKGVELNNKLLWDYLHNSYKIECYKMACSRYAENGKITKEQKREICHWINDSFGGQAWELLGLGQSRRKAESRMLLSPDWFRSTTRQFMGMFASKRLDKNLQNLASDNKFWKNVKKATDEWGITSLTGNAEASGIRGKAARAFWVRTVIYSAIFYNLLNAMFRLKDKEDNPELYENDSFIDYTIWGNSLPADTNANKIIPYIFIGRNKDGTARYLRLGKQFREIPDLLSNPIEKLSGKTAPVIGLASQTFAGMSPSDLVKYTFDKNAEVFLNQNIYDGYGKWAKKKEGAELIKGQIKTLGKGVLPFYVSNMINEKHNNSVWDMFAQTSNGLSRYKAAKQYKAAYEHGAKQSDLDKIKSKAIKDGMSYLDIVKAEKQGKKVNTENLTSKWKPQYVKALNSGDQNKVVNIADKMERNNIPADIQQKIYIQALKEFYKERGLGK